MQRIFIGSSLFYKYSKFNLHRAFDLYQSILLIMKVVNSNSHIFFQIFWCLTHSILSYREFVCSSPGATPFHYAAIDSLSQYTQTKFFNYFTSLWKVCKSGGYNMLPMIEIWFTNLPKSGGGSFAPPQPKDSDSPATAQRCIRKIDRQTQLDTKWQLDLDQPNPDQPRDISGRQGASIKGIFVLIFNLR